MVNKYKRKTKHGSWSEDAMAKAIQEVTQFKKSENLRPQNMVSHGPLYSGISKQVLLKKN